MRDPLNPETPLATALRLRRRPLLVAAAALPWLGAASPAHAGRQAEEPLTHAVRSVLSAAVADAAPPKPQFTNIQDRLSYLRWLAAMSERLRKRLPNPQVRDELLAAIWYESKRKGLETSLVLGLIQVESAFRKYAVSVVGARGYMQVMPFWSRLIGDSDPSKLFHMQTNLRFGCVILRHYLDIERGDLFLALGRYNGSRGKAEYPDAVFANRKLWTWADNAATPTASAAQATPSASATPSTPK
jgi:soluble lytic murein transglycosylase-like protein